MRILPWIVAALSAAFYACTSPGLVQSDGVVEPSALSTRWELEEATTKPKFQIRPHKQTYVLPVNWSSSPNQQVLDDAAAASGAKSLDLDPVEVKFQLSLKVKAAEDLALGGDLWVGYTQASYWQAYNSASAPFRETNYEPELTWVVPIEQEFGGWRARMLGLGLVHQSNGRGELLSRSWNRVFGLVGVEHGPFSVLLRPWWRVPESDAEDNNPNIERYMGYGDLQLVYKTGPHILSALARNNLNLDDNKGGLQLDWSMQITQALRGFIQVFSGYGESLLDYDHSQTAIGVGISLIDAL